MAGRSFALWLSLLVAVPAGQARAAGEAPPEASSGRWQQVVDQTIARLSKRFTGRIACFVSDPELGIRLGYDYEKPSYLASGVKLPFLVEVFRQVDAGRLSLDEELTYRKEDVRDGAPKLGHRPFDTRIGIRELLVAMIGHSDNAASDMLARRVGLENVQRGLVELGFDGFTPLTYLIDVRRGILREVDVHADDLSPEQIRDIRWVTGWQAQAAKLTSVLGSPPGSHTADHLKAAFGRYYETGVNSAPLDRVAAILERLARRELISAEASEAMLALLGDVHTSRNRLLGRLPPGVRVWHKTGSQWERICDLGIIELPDRHPLIITACLAGGNDRRLAEATLAELADQVYDLAVVAHRPHVVTRRASP